MLKTAVENETISCDFCVIGAGPGGLSVASAAAALGQKVVLVEKHKMGGGSLNYGCVPSKALRAVAKHANAMRMAAPFGVQSVEPRIDFQAVHDHVHGVIAAVAPNDSVERFTGLGVRVITAAGQFADRSTVVAGGYQIKARRFVVATGSSPIVPPISGLADVPYFTNETIFSNTERLPNLVVIGGGSNGMEMAQAFRRLGSYVTVLEGDKALVKHDAELSSVVLQKLRGEGIDIREHALATSVSGGKGRMVITFAENGADQTIEATHLLIAAGRRANTQNLGLDAAGIKLGAKGIAVDAGLRTANGRIYAIGDVVGGLQFTHVADDHANIVIKRSLFRLPAKTTGRPVPWVTYTDPELAHVGLSEAEARAKFGKVNVLRWPYHENSRAQAEREVEGHVKVVTTAKGLIAGATIVGAQASELIQMWSLALSQGLNIRAMTEWISPYPTLSDVNKHAAGRYFATFPNKPNIRKIVALLAKLG